MYSSFLFSPRSLELASRAQPKGDTNAYAALAAPGSAAGDGRTLELCNTTFVAHISCEGGGCAGTKGHGQGNLNPERSNRPSCVAGQPGTQRARAALTRPAAGRPLRRSAGRWPP